MSTEAVTWLIITYFYSKSYIIHIVWNESSNYDNCHNTTYRSIFRTVSCHSRLYNILMNFTLNMFQIFQISLITIYIDNIAHNIKYILMVFLLKVIRLEGVD